MKAFKRNQVEEAIARVVEAGSLKPSPELRSRIKRLLETDRGLPGGVNTEASSAFYSQEAPGRGQENWFSGYEAFALVIGLLLMRHGWPQGFAVKVLRRVRSELELAYTTTVNHDASWLFDEEAIRREAKEGGFVVRNQDPFFLTIVSSLSAGDGPEDEPYGCGVQKGDLEAMEFARGFRARGGVTMFEIVKTAYNVSVALAQTKPQSRGRS